VSGELRAPFPWFGGKSRIASVVWEVLGNVPNYVEPFFGSGAVLLARPHAPRIETVNDLDGMVSNFWRAVRAAPEEVAKHADWPIIEQDLHARRDWLCRQRESLTARLVEDPEFFDARVAGWWCWGLSSSVSGEFGTANIIAQGSQAQWCDELAFAALARRLRRIRVLCGDWLRAVTPTLTTKWRGITGVFLDPPYAEGNQQYAVGGTGTDLSAQVREWALSHGDDPEFRIVLAGLSGEHAMPASWREIDWKQKKGKQSEENDRYTRERLWLSPHCEGARQLSLLGGAR